MKKLFLLVIIAILTACEKDDVEPKPISPENTYVLIKPDESFNLKATHAGLTPTEIVQEAFSMNAKTLWVNNEDRGYELTLSRGFPDSYKDYENNILKFLATDIINDEGELINDFLKSYDFFILNEANDTIAYIPNEVLRAAEPLIEAAYEADDLNEVYRLFHEAYTYKAIE